MKSNQLVKSQEAFKLRRGVPKSAIFTVALVLLSTTALRSTTCSEPGFSARPGTDGGLSSALAYVDPTLPR